MLKASESFQARIKVSGSGNLTLFKLPKLQVPNTLEVYEPEHKEDVKTSLNNGFTVKTKEDYMTLKDLLSIAGYKESLPVYSNVKISGDKSRLSFAYQDDTVVVYHDSIIY